MKKIDELEVAIEKIALAGQLLTFLMEDMSKRINDLETEIALISEDDPTRIEVIEKDITFLKELTTQFAGNYHPLATKFREDTNNRIVDLQEQVTSLRILTKSMLEAGLKEATSKKKELAKDNVLSDLLMAITIVEKENMELRKHLDKLQEAFDNQVIINDARFVGIESNIS